MKAEPVILVPWDFSRYAAHSLKTALQLTSADKIRTICVLEVPSPYDPSIFAGFQLDKAEETCRDSFRKAVYPLRVTDATFAVVFGDPAREIVDRAREIQADLVVMGTHGRTGLKRLLLGSVAEKVLRLAPCPVLMLPRQWIESQVGEPAGEQQASPAETASA